MVEYKTLLEIVSIGNKRYVEKKHKAIICKLPNFSLAQLQVIRGVNIVIYIPEQEFLEKDYKELIQKRFGKKLKEKTEGKLEDKDINSIVEGIEVDDITDITIEVTSDPFEYGEHIIEDDEKKIESIFGDTKSGKSEYTYIEEFDDCFQKQITAMPNFSVGTIQASKVCLYDEWDNIKTESVLKIYVPEKEYEEKDYQELVHNKKRDHFVQMIKQQTNGKMDIEKIREIAARLADKIGSDNVVITTSPYEYGDKNYIEKVQPRYSNIANYIVEYIEGDTRKSPSYSVEEFSLNMLQIRKIQIKSYDTNGYGVVEDEQITEQYTIYLPNEDYIQGATYFDLLDLDYKLEEARELRDSYKRYDTKSLEECEDEYQKLIDERRKFLGQYEGEK